MAFLECGCCGTGFEGKPDPRHDQGFGDCPDCKILMEKRNEKEWIKLENKVSDSLSIKNKEKFWGYDTEVRHGLILNMIEDKLITWSIGRN